MIETALASVTEKLILLLQYREKRQQDRFDGLVQPLHEAMRQAHADYLNMFETALESLRGASTIEVVLKELARARRENEVNRHEFIRHAHFLEGHLRTEKVIAAYLREVRNYVAGADVGETGDSTPANMVINYLRRAQKSQHESSLLLDSSNNHHLRQTLEEMLIKLLVGLRSQWNVISDHYAVALSKRFI
jgi:hypothetical protein